MLAIEESDGFRAGKCYVSANGGKMRNLGQQVFPACDAEGIPFSLQLQVTENATQT